MIRVEPQPEPEDFDRRVRQPGRRALAQGKKPLPDHWVHCLENLWRAYLGVCAYACFRIPRVTGGRSVDHFSAKSRHPELAYEWTNYRLVCSLMNSRKQAFEDVLDPFEIEDGWFAFDFQTLEVVPGPGLQEDQQSRVQTTINRLKLNAADCRLERTDYLEWYRRGEWPFEQLRRWFPFAAKEMKRQGLLPSS